jgi:Cu/Ag efflux protein CusF
MKYFLILICLMFSVACNKDSSQPTVGVSPQVTPTAKRYHLKGKVVSVDAKSKMLNVDGEDIPDFMPAMTMPYEVKPEAELDKLKPGDAITADVVVQEEKAWLENIVVTGHPTAPPGKLQ